jgi:Lon protease-like protein
MVVDEIGLFPLGMVLLPTERVPLHIFEPRYRELIGECLDEGREFGLLLSDDRGLRRIGTRAVVTDVLERFDDGRLNVVVEGRERFRLVSLTSGRTYQTAEIEPLEDEPGDPARAEKERAVTQLQRVAELAGADVGEVDPREATAFELAARVEFEPELKQRLLELRSEQARLKTLTDLLERAAHAIEAQNETNRIAQTNGHLRRTPPPPEGERP